MMVWAAAQLPQRPSPSWLAACLATSQQHLPASSLLSIATQLAALQVGVQGWGSRVAESGCQG
jgi:hypothetical protein